MEILRSSIVLVFFLFACDDLGDDPIDAGPDALREDAATLDASDDAFVPDPRVTHTELGDGVTETVVDASDTEAWLALDLDAAGVVLDVELEANTAWDLALRRFTFRTNGGAGGPGSVRVAYEDGVDLDDVTRAPSVGWDQDEPGEIDPDIPPDVSGEEPPPETVISHGEDPWYDYDAATHELTPKPRVYFVESSETAYFALQIVDYYDASSGDAGYPVFRWKVVEPPDGVLPGFEVDASDAEAWVYLTLDGSVVTVLDESTDDWDVALRRTELRTNGGASGPGVGAARETDFGWGALDSTSTVGFQADTLIPPPGPPGPPAVPGNEVLATWYVYDPSTHAVGVRSNANFVIRGADGDYGKLRILAWDGGVFRIEMAEIARDVDERSTTIDARDRESWVYFSFRADAVVEPDVPVSEGTWDLALLRTQLATHSGTSGDGFGGAVEADDAFDAIDVPPASFEIDEELPLPGPPGSGTYSGNPALATWYDYDGATMTVSPRDAAFVIRTADGNFVKAQVTGWDDGTYTIRWAYAGAGRDRFGE